MKEGDIFLQRLGDKANRKIEFLKMTVYPKVHRLTLELYVRENKN